MNETQKRREQLLKNTRKLYDMEHEGNSVHPRYKADYTFPQDESEEKSSLGIRILFSMLLFLVFAIAEQYDENLYFMITECIMGK